MFDPVELLRVTRADIGGLPVLRLKGELDSYRVPHLRAQVEEVLKGRATAIYLDADELTFVDQMGLGCLVSLWLRMKNRGIQNPVHVCRPIEQVRKVLRITGLDSLICIDDELPEPQNPT